MISDANGRTNHIENGSSHFKFVFKLCRTADQRLVYIIIFVFFCYIFVGINELPYMGKLIRASGKPFVTKLTFRHFSPASFSSKKIFF